MGVGEGAACHERGHDRDAGELGQSAQLLGGVRLDDAATDVQHRTTRLDDEPSGLAHLLRVRAGDGAIARQVEVVGPLERRLRLQSVLRHVDQNRTRTTRRGEVEGLGDRTRDLAWVSHEVVVLGDRHRDAADVGLLEGVGADRLAGDLTGHRHHRDRVHVGVGDRGDEVGRTRTRGRHADADASRRLGESLGCVACTLLVAHEDVTYLRGVHERVVERKDRASRNAEDDVDPGVLQRADEALGSGHGLAHGVLWS